MLAKKLEPGRRDQNNAISIDSKDVADMYWELFTTRKPVHGQPDVSGISRQTPSPAAPTLDLSAFARAR
jgi:hypothetical protein